jgi:2-succinyl-5-enolpyruvyl-6-hydroxy-3-cyclohexene-1-carboxylate synthase
VLFRSAALEELAELVRHQPRGVIVVGPLDANDEERAAIAFLARAVGVPVLADPLSGLRRPAPDGVVTITAYDAFLRGEGVAKTLKPDWILRLGRVPTSKALMQWMRRHRDARLVVVDDQGRREDPNHAGALFVRARTAAICGVLGTAVRDLATADGARAAWTAQWQAADAAAGAALEAGCAEAPDHFEGGIVGLLAGLLPADVTLLAASSMPIRELDAFLRPGPRPLRILSNRGVNGIDGLVSTAFGIDAATDGPMVALLGDLATLHDLGGFAAAARLGRGGTIIVLNNGGGGIFSYLPLAQTEAPLDTLFATEHDLGFRHAAAMFGLEYLSPTTTAELAEHLADCRPDRARLIEVIIDKRDSVAHHRLLWRLAVDAAEAALGEGT